MAQHICTPINFNSIVIEPRICLENSYCKSVQIVIELCTYLLIYFSRIRENINLKIL